MSSGPGDRMRRIARSIVLLASVTTGCAGRPPFEEPGHAAGTLDRRAYGPPGAVDAWARWRDVAGWRVVGPPGEAARSQGHFLGDCGIRVRVSPEAEAALATLGPSTRMPVGAALVAEHTSAGGAPLPAFVMEKRPAGANPASLAWEWRVVDRTGATIARDRTVACARCHAEAVADRVFPVAPAAR